MLKWCAPILVAVFALPSAWGKPIGAEDLKKLQGNLKKPEHLSVDFKQVRFVKTTKRELRSTGAAQFERSGKFRWAHTEPTEKILVFDGATLVQFSPEDKQAARYKASAMMAKDIKEVVDVVLNVDKLLQRYTLVKGDQEGDRASIELEPKHGGGSIKDVALGISTRENLVDFVELRYADGNKTSWSFSNPKTEKLPASTFAFAPPPGVVVNDIK